MPCLLLLIVQIPPRLPALPRLDAPVGRRHCNLNPHDDCANSRTVQERQVGGDEGAGRHDCPSKKQQGREEVRREGADEGPEREGEADEGGDHAKGHVDQKVDEDLQWMVCWFVGA